VCLKWVYPSTTQKTAVGNGTAGQTTDECGVMNPSGPITSAEAARLYRDPLIGIMPVIVVKLIMVGSGIGARRWPRWC
jgi:hypothetical protein